MSRSALNDLRTEHQQMGVGPLLLAVIQETVRDVCRDYSPQIYAGSACWDRAAFDEVLQRWTLERLLSRGNLAKIVSSSESIAATMSKRPSSVSGTCPSTYQSGCRAAATSAP